VLTFVMLGYSLFAALTATAHALAITCVWLLPKTRGKVIVEETRRASGRFARAAGPAAT
jgi:hypothetical protein